MTKSSETTTTLSGQVYEASDVDKDQTPIIFLHAMLCSKEIWKGIEEKVAEATKRRVYVYDAGNHGANKHSEDFSFDQNVNDLFQFMKEINAEKAILVGHSMGGVTAIRATLKEPTKVEKLISVEMYAKLLPADLIKRIILFVGEWKKAVEELDPATKMKDVTAESVKALYEKLEKLNLPGHEQLLHEKESYLKANFVYNKDPTTGKYSLKFNDKAITEFLNKYEELEKGFFKTLEESKKKCEVPSYFIYAANSHYEIKSELENIKQYFENVEFVEIDGVAHLIFVEKPEKFTEELVKCLQK